MCFTNRKPRTAAQKSSEREKLTLQRYGRDAIQATKKNKTKLDVWSASKYPVKSSLQNFSYFVTK